MRQTLRLLFVGDVVGPAGCAAVQAFMPDLRRDLALDAIIINGENSADNGFGITERTAALLLSVADFVTLGDHAFDQPGSGPLLDREPRIIRPANWDADVAGRGWGVFTAAGMHVGVLNLLGTVFMQPPVVSQYATADRAIAALHDAGADLVVVDLQAEATSEKQAIGWYLAGKVAAVLGTHTHTPTADLRILPGGTAYVSDVGMIGGKDGIIGFSREWFLRRISGAKPSGPPTPQEGPGHLDAVLIEVDVASGRALHVERIVKEQDATSG